MGTDNMQHNSVPNKRVYRAEEIANFLGINTSSAYELVKKDISKRYKLEHQFAYLKNPLMNGLAARLLKSLMVR